MGAAPLHCFTISALAQYEAAKCQWSCCFYARSHLQLKKINLNRPAVVLETALLRRQADLSLW